MFSRPKGTHVTAIVDVTGKPTASRSKVVAKITSSALLACLTGIASGVVLCGRASAQEVRTVRGAVVQKRTYTIAAGTLDQVLNQFANEAGVELSVDSALTQGKTSAGLSGSYTVEEGFAELAKGQALQVVRGQTGAYSLRAAAAPGDRDVAVMKAIKVEASETNLALTEGTGSYTTRALTIGKTTQSLRETPQSVSVITARRMQDQNLVTVTDALEQAPGIILQTPANPQQPEFYSRGFAIDTVEFDGQPTLSDNSVYSNMDSAMYERIEILRGAAGLLQGAGNPGGIVNLVRKKPTDHLAMSGDFSVGSWETYRGMADVGGPLNDSGSLRGRMVTMYQSNDYFYNVADQRKNLFYGVLEYDLTPQTLLTVGGNIYNANLTPMMNGLPMYSDGRSLGLPRSTFLEPDWNRWDYQYDNLFAKVEQHFAGEWQANLTASRLRGTSHLKYSCTTGAVDPETAEGANMNCGAQNSFDDSQQGVDLDVSGPIELFGRKHTLSFGGNWREYNSGGAYGGIDTNYPVDVHRFDPHSIPEPGAPMNVGRYASRYRQSGLYAAGRFSLMDPLTLVLGARVGNYRQEGAPPQIIDHRLSSYGGLVWDISHSYSLYVSYADIFRTQFGNTWTGDLLPPVTGANYEAGVKGEFYDGLLNASFALFRTSEDNRATEDPQHPCATATVFGWCNITQGVVRSQGAELEASGRLAEGWEVAGGYTYNTTKYERDPAQQGLAYSTITPKHLLKIWTVYRLPGQFERWSVGGGVNLQSEFYVSDGTVRLQQRGYALASAHVSYKVNEHVDLSLNGNNLFDKAYWQTFNYSGGANYYGEPRNFMLSLHARN